MSVGNIEKRGVNKYRLTVSDGFDGNGQQIKYRKTISATSERDTGQQAGQAVYALLNHTHFRLLQLYSLF